MPKTSTLASPAPALTVPADAPAGPTSVLGILVALSVCHLLNDAMQALLPALYPVLKDSLRLNFSQIGWITFVFQMVGSVLQPVVGIYTDRTPRPYSLVFGMGVTLGGLVLLALAPAYSVVLAAAGCIGLGSAIFHPEASRMARAASGGRHGFAQSLFQVGGNAGTALGPLLAAGFIVPHGQRHVLWFGALALAGMVILSRVGAWYRSRLTAIARQAASAGRPRSHLRPAQVTMAIVVLLALMFSKFFYLAAITNYYTFYLMHRFNVSVQQSQFYLFLFLGAGAAGTILGGPLGDRFGRKRVIWFSILGVAPFALLLPHVGLFWTAALSMPIALIMASAFPAILVFAVELLPGRVGAISGLFFGLAFGLAGIGSAVLGLLADATSIEHVMKVCAWLPLIGLLTWFLPELRERAES